MKTITSKEAIQALPVILDNQTIEPIKITKQSGDHAVLISHRAYNQLKSAKVTEDDILGFMAEQSLKSGLLSDSESDEFMSWLGKYSAS